jgi:hypothetical protein
MVRRNRQRANRRQRRLISPQIYITEEVSISGADTVSNTAFYAPPISTTEVEMPTMFHLRSSDVTVQAGNANTRVFAVIRRVPSGYSAPSITITNGINVIIDMPDVLAYGLSNITTGATDNTLRLHLLKPNMRLYPGDNVTLQVVSNGASTSQTYSSLTEYALST